MFYAERTSTDQIAGLVGSLRYDIDRKHLQVEMTGRLQRLGQTLQDRQ